MIFAATDCAGFASWEEVRLASAASTEMSAVVVSSISIEVEATAVGCDIGF